MVGQCGDPQLLQKRGVNSDDCSINVFTPKLKKSCRLTKINIRIEVPWASKTEELDLAAFVS